MRVCELLQGQRQVLENGEANMMETGRADQLYKHIFGMLSTIRNHSHSIIFDKHKLMLLCKYDIVLHIDSTADTKGPNCIQKTGAAESFQLLV